MARFRGSRIEVRQSIIEQNAKTLKSMAGANFFCPMVKANAYGHGVQAVSETLINLGVDCLGVATFDEAAELREFTRAQDILVFSRVRDREEAKLAVEKNLITVVSREEDLITLDQVARQQSSSARVHLKFDTGIHRMGFPENQAQKVLENLKNLSAIKLEGVATHLSQSEDFGSEGGMTQAQLRKFSEIQKLFHSHNLHFHALNTSGMLQMASRPQLQSHLGCRPGIGLYGAINDPRLSKNPAMRISSEIDHLQNVPVGEGVSYGWTWRAKKNSLVGVVPIGYGDGYLRSLSNRAFVLVHGVRVPVVGSVCMDYILVDLTDLSQSTSSLLKVSDEVVLLGEQKSELITPMDLANWSGTISYEILTQLGLTKNRVEVV